MDVEDYESEGGDVSGEEMGAPPSLLAFEGGVVSGSLEVEAGALGQVLDLSVPLSEGVNKKVRLSRMWPRAPSTATCPTHTHPALY